MRMRILCVGRPGRLLARPIAEYEGRAGRYFDLEVVELKAGRGSPDQAREDESGALVARLPERCRSFALTRGGDVLGSRELADELRDVATYGPGSVAWLIGGAFGLSPAALAAVDRRVSLSGFTLPHEFARLVLAEQIYRAGTLLRGEPYHKGP